MPEPENESQVSGVRRLLYSIAAVPLVGGVSLLWAVVYISIVGFSILLIVSIVQWLVGSEEAGATFMLAGLLFLVAMIFGAIIKALGLDLSKPLD